MAEAALKDHHNNLGIGFLGPRGSFTEEALIKLIKNENISTTPINSIEEILEAIDTGDLVNGIVPIENSIEGPVNVTLDMLIHEVSLKIIDEVVMPIRHNFITVPGTRLENIKKIYSHPQAIAQCRKFLRNVLPEAEIEYTQSTSEAIKKVKEEKPSCGAIGTWRGAVRFDLEVKFANIQDYESNQTRFVLLAKDKVNKDFFKKENYKTSLAFALPDKPGALYEVLKEFAFNQINMTKIESRPTKKELGEYIFLVDIEGHEEDQVIANALEKISQKTTFIKNLGSY